MAHRGERFARLGLALTLTAIGCVSSTTTALETPVDAKPTASETAPEPAPEHPQTAARELYRLSEARFAEGDAAGGAGLLQESIAAMPDDVDPVLRHQLEARLTHMQLTAWQADEDLQHVLAARQRLFTRMTSFPKVVAELTPDQADTMRDELFEQLSDVEAQLELYLEDDEPTDSELAVLAAVADARAPNKAADSPEAPLGTSRRRRAADGSEIREIDVKTRRQSPFDDPEAEVRFNGRFASPGLVLTRGADVVHGPRGLVRVLGATDAAGRGARGRARKFVVAHRDALVDCYEAAFGRFPIFGLEVDVKLSMSGADVQTAELTRGALIDPEGDRCLTDALNSMGGYPGASGEQGVSIELLFFFEDTVLINPATGEAFSPGQPPTKAGEPDPVEMNKFAPMGR